MTGDSPVRGLSTDQLRAEVRAVLRDVLPSLTGVGRPTGAPEGAGAEEVTLRTGADLDALVRRVAVLCEDPAQRAALQQGRRRFRLAGGPPAGRDGTPAGPPEPKAAVVRVDRGAVTERLVRKAAADGARVVLGRRAVLTPLARDRARSLGVTIEKEH